MEDISDLVNLIIKSSQRVLNDLGIGHSEKIYHKGLHAELSCLGFNLTSEYHLAVCYKDSKGGEHILESERIDIFIHSDNDSIFEILKNTNIILELKSIKSLGNSESIQVNKYFNELNKKKIRIDYGIIINFPKDKNEIDYLLIKNSE